MICPIMSNPKSMTDTEALYPCVNACELRVNGHCAITQIAKKLSDISSKSNG